MFVAKFSFSPYQRAHLHGHFEPKGSTGQYFDHHPHELVLAMYDESQWAAFQTAMKKGSLCRDRQQLAKWQTPIKPTYREEPGARNGAMVPRRDFEFEQVLKPPSRTAHYWFAVLMDCYLEEYDAHPPALQYKITFINGRSHLPADESGMITINLITLIAMAVYGGWFFARAIARMRSVGQAHLITLIFALAYALQALSVLCELLHLRRYALDGKGLRWRHTLFALDYVSGLSQSIAELVLSLMLIALAFGWTLGLESQEPLDGLLGRLLAGFHRPAHLLRGFRSPSALLLAAIGGVQLVLHALGRRYEEDFNNFHDFEHWPGMLLVAIRLALCAVFVWALRRSMRVETQREVLAFLRKLSLFGSLWFVCLPALVLMALVLPPYRRHQLVAGGSVLVQAAALALLSMLFAEGSHYYKMSSLAHVGSVFNHGGFSAGFPAARGGAKIAVD